MNLNSKRKEMTACRNFRITVQIRSSFFLAAFEGPSTVAENKDRHFKDAKKCFLVVGLFTTLRERCRSCF